MHLLFVPSQLEPLLQSSVATAGDPPVIHIKQFTSGSVVARLNVYTPKSGNDEGTLLDLRSALESIAQNSNGYVAEEMLLVESAGM